MRCYCCSFFHWICCDLSKHRFRKQCHWQRSLLPWVVLFTNWFAQAAQASPFLTWNWVHIWNRVCWKTAMNTQVRESRRLFCTLSLARSDSSSVWVPFSLRGYLSSFSSSTKFSLQALFLDCSKCIMEGYILLLILRRNKKDWSHETGSWKLGIRSGLYSC